MLSASVCVVGLYKDDTLISLLLLYSQSSLLPIQEKKNPHASRHGANKENLELNGSFLSGGYPSSAPLQRNFSINSVASTYSEFAVIHPF